MLWNTIALTARAQSIAMDPVRSVIDRHLLREVDYAAFGRAITRYIADSISCALSWIIA